MLDAISRALTLHGEDLAHQVVVLFTNGDDHHSLSSRQGVEGCLRASQATVYVVTLGVGSRIQRVRTPRGPARRHRQPPEPHRVRARPSSGRLTGVSGGRSFPIERIEDVDRALDAVPGDLGDRYLIGYRPSKAELDGTWRQILPRCR